jgi:ribosomal protein L31
MVPLSIFFLAALVYQATAVPVDFTYTLYSLEDRVDHLPPTKGYLFDDEGLLAHLQTKVAPYPMSSCVRKDYVTTVNRFSIFMKITDVYPLDVESIEDMLDYYDCPIVPIDPSTSGLHDEDYHIYRNPRFYEFDALLMNNSGCKIDWVFSGSLPIDEIVGTPPFHDFCTQGGVEFDIASSNETTDTGCRIVPVTIPFWSGNCNRTKSHNRVESLRNSPFMNGIENWIYILVSCVGSAGFIAVIGWVTRGWVRRRRKMSIDMYEPLSKDGDAIDSVNSL